MVGSAPVNHLFLPAVILPDRRRPGNPRPVLRVILFSGSSWLGSGCLAARTPLVHGWIRQCHVLKSSAFYGPSAARGRLRGCSWRSFLFGGCVAWLLKIPGMCRKEYRQKCVVKEQLGSNIDVWGRTTGEMANAQLDPWLVRGFQDAGVAGQTWLGDQLTCSTCVEPTGV